MFTLNSNKDESPIYAVRKMHAVSYNTCTFSPYTCTSAKLLISLTSKCKQKVICCTHDGKTSPKLYFWSGNFFLIAHFPDHSLLVFFYGGYIITMCRDICPEDTCPTAELLSKLYQNRNVSVGQYHSNKNKPSHFIGKTDEVSLASP